MKIKKPFTPTRRCPHRWCRRVHTLTASLCLAVLGPALFHASVLYIVFMVITMLVVFQVVRLAWKGKSLVDMAMEDAAAQGSGSQGNMSSRFLVVRPVWARIALVMDFVGLFNVVAILAGDIHNHGADHSTPTTSASALITIGVTAVICWFWEFAHRKATEPAKPLRMPVLIQTPEGQS